MGHELNPRIGSFDFKFFCEMRPGLIGWVMLDVIFLVKNYQEYGEINLPLAFVTISQALYVADGLWLEVRIQMSRVIKPPPAFCICENKDGDQLCSNQ